MPPDSLPSRSGRLSPQQRAVLLAIVETHMPVPTTILRDVRVRYSDAFPWHEYARTDRSYPIGEPVGSVLRRLEKRGLVTGEMGSDCKEWRITDDGLALIGWSR